jgi:hypothetical protein
MPKSGVRRVERQLELFTLHVGATEVLGVRERYVSSCWASDRKQLFQGHLGAKVSCISQTQACVLKRVEILSGEDAGTSSYIGRCDARSCQELVEKSPFSWVTADAHCLQHEKKDQRITEYCCTHDDCNSQVDCKRDAKQSLRTVLQWVLWTSAAMLVVLAVSTVWCYHLHQRRMEQMRRQDKRLLSHFLQDGAELD